MPRPGWVVHRAICEADWGCARFRRLENVFSRPRAMLGPAVIFTCHPGPVAFAG